MDSTRRTSWAWTACRGDVAGRREARNTRRGAWPGALLVVAVGTAACGGGHGDALRGRTSGSEAPAPGDADEAATDAIVAEPDPTGPEAECDAFNRREAARAAEPPGRCPHCPCFCDPVRGIVCAPCARCEENENAIEFGSYY